MSKIDEADFQPAAVWTMQIIVAALSAGVILFWGLVTLVFSREPAGPMLMGLPLMTAMSLLFGVLSTAASVVAPMLMVDGALKQIAKKQITEATHREAPGSRQVYPASDAGKLLPVYQTQLIVASALNEGAAFFAAIAYMLEGHVAAMFVGGLMIAMLLSRFPTADRVRGWMDAQLERLAVRRRDDF